MDVIPAPKLELCLFRSQVTASKKESNVQHIVNKLETYMSQWGGNYAAWYAGIASSPRERLFNDHAVREQGDGWIFDNCGSDTAAREIEQYFLSRGCQGGPGGGDSQTKYIYVYRVAPHTLENN